MIYWFGLWLVVAALLWERHQLQRARARVSVRVHVHGTRGKSSTVALLTARLRAAGLVVLGKTTGDAAEYILPNGQRSPVGRWGPARINEHVDAVRLAARMNADALVVEGMALQPETIHVSETMLKATHAVIGNLRPDHAETMGRGRRSVLRTLQLMMPSSGTLYTTDELGGRSLAARARQAKVPCVVVPSSLLDQSSRIAAAVATDILVSHGNAREQAPGEGGSSQRAGSAMPKLACVRGRMHGLDVTFHDLFSANDVASSGILLRAFAGDKGQFDLRVALLATRADRPMRSPAVAEWLRGEDSFDLVVPVGSHAWYAYLALRGGADMARNRFLGLVNPWVGVDVVMRRICSVAVGRGAQRLTLLGLGSAHGAGMKWREDLPRRIREDAAGSDRR